MLRDTRRVLAVISLASFAALTPSRASELYVDCADASVFTTIGDALQVAGDGDTVIVEPCTEPPFAYTEDVRIAGRHQLRLIASDALGSDARQVGVGRALIDPPPVRIESRAHGRDCVTVEASSRVAVVGFHLDGCDRYGIQLLDSADVVLHGNYIENVGRAGIGGRGNDHVSVIGNAVVGSLREGIELDGDRATLVADNVLRRNGSQEIALDPREGALALSNDLWHDPQADPQPLSGSDDPVDRFLTFSIGTVGPVAIGTNDADRLLDVTGPAAEVEIDSTGGGDGPELVLTNSAGALPGSWGFKYRQSDGRFTLYRDQDPNQEFLSISADGNVGIHNKTPDRLLDVTGESAEVEIDSTGGGDGPELLLTYSGLGVPGTWSMKNRASDGRLSLLRDLDPSQEYLTVGADGNVGVGTQTPSQTLHVGGRGRFDDGIEFYGCGIYTAAAICPLGDIDGPNCDDVPIGSFCESDGECGTNASLDNCGSFDWYVKTGE